SSKSTIAITTSRRATRRSGISGSPTTISTGAAKKQSKGNNPVGACFASDPARRAGKTPPPRGHKELSLARQAPTGVITNRKFMAAIYLIRHGQASWGKRDYDALSEQGVEQAKILGKALAQRIDTPDRIICGGMRRHRQTAEHALAAMGLRSDWHEDKRWDEYDHQELIVRHKPLYKSRTLMLADLARTLKPKETFQEIFEQALHRWVARE